MLIDINKVIVNGRIRKDFGNIEELANDIRDNGLINPPVVTPDMELIAGERRLRAMKHLGWPQVEVRVMTVEDALHQLKLEISENENRKDFSFSEKMEWAERLEAELQKVAACNQTSGKHLPEGGAGRVRDKVAEQVDMGSGENYRKAKYIKANADEEMIRQLDEGQLSINGAYVRLKKQVEEAAAQLAEKNAEIANLQAEVVDAANAVKASTDSEEYIRAKKAKEEMAEQHRQEYEKRRALETKTEDQAKQINMLRDQVANAAKKLAEMQEQKEVMGEPEVEVREVEVEVKVYPEDYERLKRDMRFLDEENERLAALVAELKTDKNPQMPSGPVNEVDELEWFYDKVTMFNAAVVPEIDSIMVGAERFALMTLSQRDFIADGITRCIHSFNEMMTALKNSSNKEAA